MSVLEPDKSEFKGALDRLVVLDEIWHSSLICYTCLRLFQHGQIVSCSRQLVTDGTVLLLVFNEAGD